MRTLVQFGYESVSLLHIPDILLTELWPNSQSVCQCAPRPLMSPHNIEYHARSIAADGAAAPEAQGPTVPLVPSRERL